MAAMLAKVTAGSDAFTSEKYHDQLAVILGGWRKDLLQGPQNVGTIAAALREDFTGSTLLPSASRMVRSDSTLEIRHHQFSARADLTRDGFIEQLRGYLSSFSKFLTADFQITGIDLGPGQAGVGVPAAITTTVRYELVGSGANCYREQRVGDWKMMWRGDGSEKFRLAQWTAAGEIESRSAQPAFADISGQTLGSNSSYAAQLTLGVDYWRTVLDGASGIDIYGHNGVSFGDIDNDGCDDLYICQPSGLPNRLYRNRGDGTFEDVTEAAGVGVLENSACALFADIDNDGRQDLIVVRAGNGPLLFKNEGGGKFQAKPHAFRFADRRKERLRERP